MRCGRGKRGVSCMGVAVGYQNARGVAVSVLNAPAGRRGAIKTGCARATALHPLTRRPPAAAAVAQPQPTLSAPLCDRPVVCRTPPLPNRRTPLSSTATQAEDR